MVHRFSYVFHQVVTHRLLHSFARFIFPLVLHVVCYVRIVIIFQSIFNVVLVQNTWRLKIVNCNWRYSLHRKIFWTKIEFFLPIPWYFIEYLAYPPKSWEEAIMGRSETGSWKKQENSGNRYVIAANWARGEWWGVRGEGEVNTKIGHMGVKGSLERAESLSR